MVTGPVADTRLSMDDMFAVEDKMTVEEFVFSIEDSFVENVVQYDKMRLQKTAYCESSG